LTPLQTICDAYLNEVPSCFSTGPACGARDMSAIPFPFLLRAIPLRVIGRLPSFFIYPCVVRALSAGSSLIVRVRPQLMLTARAQHDEFRGNVLPPCPISRVYLPSFARVVDARAGFSVLFFPTIGAYFLFVSLYVALLVYPRSPPLTIPLAKALIRRTEISR